MMHYYFYDVYITHRATGLASYATQSAVIVVLEL